MKTPQTFPRHVAAALGAAVLTAVGLMATPHARAADDCYAMGEQVAAQKGGTLFRARAITQGGRQACELVILVPSRDGDRPRREVVVVPKG